MHVGSQTPFRNPTNCIDWGLHPRLYPLDVAFGLYLTGTPGVSGARNREVKGGIAAGFSMQNFWPKAVLIHD